MANDIQEKSDLVVEIERMLVHDYCERYGDAWEECTVEWTRQEKAPRAGTGRRRWATVTGSASSATGPRQTYAVSVRDVGGAAEIKVVVERSGWFRSPTGHGRVTS